MSLRTGVWTFTEPLYGTSISLIRCPWATLRRVATRLPKPLQRLMIQEGFYEYKHAAGPGGRAWVGIDIVPGAGSGTEYAVIWINPGRDGAAFVSVAVHEALHVCARVLRNVGLPLEEASEEAYTYYTDWLTRMICVKMGFCR